MTNKIKLSMAAALLVASTNIMASEDLGTVYVTGSSFKTQESKASYSTEIYTQKDIVKSNATNIYQFLNEQTGITTMPNYGNPFSQKIDLRGYGTTDGYQNIVIAVDGRRMNNVDMVPQLLSSISVDNIEQIEIIKGAGSVEHGDGATAGIMKITTKGQNSNYVKAYYGNDSTKYGILSLGHSTNNLIINAQADYYATDGVKDDDRDSKNKSLDIKYFPNDDLELRAKRSDSKLYTKYAKSLTLDEFNNDIKKDKGFSEQEFNSYVTSLGTTYYFNPDISFEIDYNDEDKLSNFITWSNKMDYEYKSLNSKLKIKKDNFKIALGFDKFDGDVAGKADLTTKENQGIFISSIYNVNEKNIVNVGLRKEKVNYTYKHNTSTALDTNENLKAYNLGVNHTLNDNQSFFLNYNKSFQAPDINRFFTGGWGGTAKSFNSFIDPAISKTLNIGFNDFRASNKLKVTLFRTNLTNEIYYNSGTFKNTNIDKSHKYGLELFDKYRISENYYTSLNYNYIIAKIDDENDSNGAFNGKNMPGVSKHNITLNFGFSIDKFSGVLSKKYRSEAYSSNDFENKLSQKQKSYNSTNLSVKYEYNKQLEFFLKVQNLFNKKNGLWTRNDNIYPVNYTRTSYAGVKYSF